MKIARIDTWSVFIPYAAPVGPYIGMPERKRGAGTLGASALIVRIDTDEGLTGWGEGIGVLEPAAIERLIGSDALDIETMLMLMQQIGIAAGPASGVEMALWDLLGKAAGLPLCRLLGGRLRDRAEFTACMGLKEPSESAATAREYCQRWGFRSIKTKAGSDQQQDLAIAAAIVAEMGDDAQLRSDANAGYSAAETLAQMQRMKDVGVNLFEDPCARDHIDTLVRCRDEVGMEILVNMGITTPRSVTDLLVAGAADWLMPDTPGAGGLLPVQKVARVAEGFGIPCLMHCAHDLGLKTAAITHLAAATPNFSGPSDTCYHGLVDDVLTQKLVFSEGSIAVPDGHGLGVIVDEDKLNMYLVE